jgi:hypothetical protein
VESIIAIEPEHGSDRKRLRIHGNHFLSWYLDAFQEGERQIEKQGMLRKEQREECCWVDNEGYALRENQVMRFAQKASNVEYN